MKRIPRACEHCSASFFADPNEVAKGWARFCSIQCANAAKFGPPEERFWKSVNKTDDCWLWTASLDKDGYGKFYVNGKHIRAHAYSFTLHTGESTTGKMVCHSCDNPTCVRPDHLWLGTSKENNHDAINKGPRPAWFMVNPEQRARGSHSGTSKLTESQVLEIRARFAAGGISQ